MKKYYRYFIAYSFRFSDVKEIFTASHMFDFEFKIESNQELDFALKHVKNLHANFESNKEIEILFIINFKFIKELTYDK